MTNPVLQYKNVDKSFSGVPVLHDVSFALGHGELLGLVGENGAGKSTLMNILGGVFPLDSGEILLDGQPYCPHNPADARSAGIAFVHQELNLFPNLSISENLFIDSFPAKSRFGIPWIDRRSMRNRTIPLLQAVDLHRFPDTVVEDLSPAERQLVEIAKALSFDARILILDEPTTSLTSHETEKLFEIIERLRKQRISIIYISHDLEDVFRLSDRIFILRDGELVGQGPSIEFDMDRVVSLMVGRSIEQFYPPRKTKPSSVPLLEVRNVSQPGIVKDIHFTLHKGEVLGVFGLMGSGRTELARILFGLDRCESGEIFLAERRIPRLCPRNCIRKNMAFLTEDRREEGLLLDANVEDNVALVSLGSFALKYVRWIQRSRLREAVHRVVASVRIQCASVNKQPVHTLSGGNQQKTVLSKWLLSNPLALILDEPTRGIDVGAKCEIYNLINELVAAGAGVLFISSEIEELLGTCDRILVMGNGEIRDSVDRDRFDREAILQSALEDKAK